MGTYQITQTVDKKSVTVDLHIDPNQINRLIDATAAGPTPNILPQTTSGGGAGPGPTAQGAISVPGNSTMFVAQAIVVEPSTVYNADKARSNPEPKKGSKGGKGAGKGFSSKLKDFIRSMFDNKCAFCGAETIRSKEPNPLRSNIDHAIPKSRGGNNSAENAQNACQDCNLAKGDLTTQEFLNQR